MADRKFGWIWQIWCLFFWHNPMNLLRPVSLQKG